MPENYVILWHRKARKLRNFLAQKNDHLRIFVGSLSHKFPTQPNQRSMIQGVITLFAASRIALTGKVAASYIIKGDARLVVQRLYRAPRCKWKSLLKKMVANGGIRKEDNPVEMTAEVCWPRLEYQISGLVDNNGNVVHKDFPTEVVRDANHRAQKIPLALG